MSVFLVVPIVVPVLGALGHALTGWRPWVGPVSAALTLVSGIAVRSGGTFGGVLRADALSAFMLVVIGAVALVATLSAPAHLRAEIDAGRATRRTAQRQGVLVQLFLAAMALAVLAADLGVLWVAVEATTIITAFLVGQRRTRRSVEAAWKYVVICSAGIALALLGAILLNFAAANAPGAPGLDLAALAAHGAGLDPGVTRIAVALLVVGFGAKAGLAPLHAWLPDAHSQAPAPVSALMSGVLLSVAFYAILRVRTIADAALGPGFTRVLLAVLGIASLLVAASLLIAQRDYKRMLAYSSIEHLGLVAVGTAVGGPLALAAVLLHILGHGLAKAALFVGAGQVLRLTGTSGIDGVRGLAVRNPLLGGVFGFGVLALIGLPPFSVFASELGMVRAGFSSGLGWLMAVALVLVLVCAVALVGHTSRMLLGTPHDGPGAAAAPARLPVAVAVALTGALVACAVLGVLAAPLADLLHAAAAVLTGGAR